LGTDGLVGAQNNIFLDTPTNSRTANTITRYGNVTQGTFSPYTKEAGKWSNYFDGAGGISVPYSSAFDFGTGEFSIKCDVFVTSYPTNRGVVFGRVNDWTGSQYWLEVTSSGKVALTRSGGAIITSTQTIPLNSWCSVEVYRIGTTAYIDIKGQITTFTNTTWNLTAGDLGGEFTIGADQGVNSFFFKGYISNLKITKAGTVVLDTCKDNRFKDNSIYNHTLTPSGNVKVSPFSPYANSADYDASVYGGSGYFDGDNKSDRLWSNGLNQQSTEPLDITFNTYSTGTSISNGVTALFGRRYQGNGVWVRMTAPTSLSFNASVVNEFMTLPRSVINDNQWHTWRFYQTAAGGKMSVELDGSLVGTTVANIPLFDMDKFGIGGTDDNNYTFKGYISNFVVKKAGSEVLNLKFNNAGIRDESGMNCIETVGDAKVSSDGQGVVFDGGGDYLAIADSTNLALGTGDFEVSCDVFLNSYASNAGIVILNSGSTSQSLFQFKFHGSTSWGLADYTTWLIESTTLPALNTWQKLTVFRIGGQLGLKLNSNQIGATVANTNNFASGTNVVGAYVPTNNYINGTIKNLTITKGA
jgi:hypothetical protein